VPKGSQGGGGNMPKGTLGHPKVTRVLKGSKGLPRCSEECPRVAKGGQTSKRGSKGYSKIPKSAQRFIKGVQGRPSVPKSAIIECPRVSKHVKGCHRVDKGSQL
jgi:hypothetical protein